MFLSPYLEANDLYVARVLEYQKTKDDQLGSSIIRDLEPLVVVACRAYFLLNGSKEDLLQEGRLGLFKAMRDFRAEIGIPFCRFALQCIQRQCLTAIKTSLRQKHLMLTETVSLSQPISFKNTEATLEDLISDPKSDEAEKSIIRDDDFQQCRHLLKSSLSPYEYDVLLAWLQGSRYDAIAKSLQRSNKSIDNALQRAKHHLDVFHQQDPEFFSAFQHFVQISRSKNRQCI